MSQPPRHVNLLFIAGVVGVFAVSGCSGSSGANNTNNTNTNDEERCGDGICNGAEDCERCAEDCGDCPIPRCQASGPEWTNISLHEPVLATMSAQWNATPHGASIDSLVMFSQGAGGAFADFAVLVGFQADGRIVARNAGEYAGDTTLNYVAGAAYAFRVEVDIVNHTYDVFVTPAGGSEVQLANDYAFRTEQQGVPSLDNVAMHAEAGSAEICELTVQGVSLFTAECGNGTVENGELCDGNCPTSCDDSDDCTTDSLVGSPEDCDAACLHTTIPGCGIDISVLDTFVGCGRACWDSQFASSTDGAPGLVYTGDIDDIGNYYAWQSYYWLRSYVTMARLFQDTTYVDRAIALIDAIFYNRDDFRQARGEFTTQSYDSAPLFYLNNRNAAAMGWRRVYGSEVRIETLTDGMIVNGIMRVVDLIYSEGAFAAYRPQAADYIDLVEETINDHEDCWVDDRYATIPGAWYYPNPNGSGLYSNPIPFNHNATMLTAAILVDKVRGTSTYSDKAERLLGYFFDAEWMIGNAYVWYYSPHQPTLNGPSEDFNHAHIDMGFLIEAYHQGIAGITLTDMTRFATTLTDLLYRGNGDLYRRVDGTDTSLSTSDHVSVGFDWIDLAEFDPLVNTIAHEVVSSHAPNPTWSRPFLAWAELMRWHVTLNSP